MALQGLGVAFDAAPLDAAPTWTRIDTGITGVGVNHIQIRRGRPNEREKTGIGTMTVDGHDTAGTLDPTNAGGAYYGKIDPDKQIGYALQNPHTLAYSTIYRGYVAAWRFDLTTLTRKANVIAVTVEAKDALALISDAEVIPDVAGNTVPSESVGDVYYDAETITEDRLLAAIADTATTFNPYGADWPAGLLDLFSGNVKLKGAVYSSQSSLLQVIDEASDAEFPWVANRFVSNDGKITFRGREARFNPSAYSIPTWNVGDTAAFNADSTVAVISDFAFDRSDENIINCALATPAGIKSAEIAGQFVSDSTSVTAHGARSVSWTELLTDGRSDGTTTDLEETKLFASYAVDNYKDPQNRISTISFRPVDASTTRGQNVWALMCGIELSDIVHVKTTHPGGGGFDADFFVEGITYDIVPMTDTHPEVTLTLDVSPRAAYDTNPF